MAQSASSKPSAAGFLCSVVDARRPPLEPELRAALGLEALRVACDAVQRQAELTTVRLFPRLFPTRAALRPGCPVPPHHAYTRFHSVTYPETTLYELAAALSQRTGFGTDVLMSALVLAARAGAAMPEGQMTAHQVHRLFLASASVTHKVLWDRPYKAKTFAKAVNLCPVEMTLLETELLDLVDWKALVVASEVVSLRKWSVGHGATAGDPTAPLFAPEVVVLRRRSTPKPPSESASSVVSAVGEDDALATPPPSAAVSTLE